MGIVPAISSPRDVFPSRNFVLVSLLEFPLGYEDSFLVGFKLARDFVGVAGRIEVIPTVSCSGTGSRSAAHSRC